MRLTPTSKPFLSVIIPVYNEEQFIETTLRLVSQLPPEKEIIVVNDGSNDGTREKIDQSIKQQGKQRSPSPYLKNITVIHKPTNEGKGAAIRSGLEKVSGNIVLIQDADLELDPHEYPQLLEPFRCQGADIVFGSRFSFNKLSSNGFWHQFGNQLLTRFSNLLSGLKLTDMETGYKVFRTEIITTAPLISNRFGIEPELAALAARAVRLRGAKFYEVPISYRPRTYAQGKKINWKDGLLALWSIFYFNIINRKQ